MGDHESLTFVIENITLINLGTPDEP